MSEQEFQNRIDGLVNDFETGIIDGRELRDGICEVIITICGSKLEKDRPAFTAIKTVDELREVLESMDDVNELNTLRDEVRAYQKTGKSSPLKHREYGFATVYKALDNRAVELGFTKFSFGYRDPKKLQKNG